jgi:hypothetical protein
MYVNMKELNASCTTLQMISMIACNYSLVIIFKRCANCCLGTSIKKQNQMVFLVLFHFMGWYAIVDSPGRMSTAFSSVCGSRNTCQSGKISQLFLVTNHEKDGLPDVRIYEDIWVGARVIWGQCTIFELLHQGVHPLKSKIRWCFSSCFILWDDMQLSTLLEECWCVTDKIFLIWE